MPYYRIVSIFDPTGNVNLEEEFQKARKISSELLPISSNISQLQSAILTGKSYVYTAHTSCREAVCSILTPIFEIGRITRTTNVIFTKIYIEDNACKNIDLRSINKIICGITNFQRPVLNCKREEDKFRRDFVIELLPDAYIVSPIVISTVLLILRDTFLYEYILNTKKQLFELCGDNFDENALMRRVLILGILRNVVELYTSNRSSKFAYSMDGSDILSKFMLAIFISMKMYRVIVPLDGYTGPVDYISNQNIQKPLYHISEVVLWISRQIPSFFSPIEKKVLKEFLEVFIRVRINTQEFETNFWNNLSLVD